LVVEVDPGAQPRHQFRDLLLLDIMVDQVVVLGQDSDFLLGQQR
jgi:hypothetical protein